MKKKTIKKYFKTGQIIVSYKFNLEVCKADLEEAFRKLIAEHSARQAM
ncbi:MAG: hypothetical protein JW903_01300 [Clostridia bacterium]|nr:hypothetical protein [Clostridia bacterium]